MADISGKVALVTGASSGIGKSTVLNLIGAGVKVYAAARRTGQMQDLKDAGAEIQSLDVCDDASIKKTVKTILNNDKRIDILVNNAGYGSYGAIEDVPIVEARRQFEVNIFGLANITRLIIPEMRKNAYGKIVNLSSMGGKVYTPFGGWYHATKHALEGLSDSLRLETQGFGIDVIIIEPGAIATPWGTIAADHLRKTSICGAYKEWAAKTADNMEKLYTGGKIPGPDLIGKLILKALKARRPKIRYVAGYMARPSIFVRKFFGDRLFDRIIKSSI
jgi:NAD(P)-dependent dehydrogenase (short-subunit alcohol dehydrogenase family)